MEPKNQNDTYFSYQDRVMAKLFEQMAASGLAGYYLEKNKQMSAEYEALVESNPDDPKLLAYGTNIMKDQMNSLKILDMIRNGKYRLVFLGVSHIFNTTADEHDSNITLSDIVKLDEHIDEENNAVDSLAMQEAIKLSSELHDFLTSDEFSDMMNKEEENEDDE